MISDGARVFRNTQKRTGGGRRPWSPPRRSAHPQGHRLFLAFLFASRLHRSPSPLKGPSPPLGRSPPSTCSGPGQPRRRASSSRHAGAPRPPPSVPSVPAVPPGSPTPAPPAGCREGRGVPRRLPWDVEFWKMFPELPEAKFISPGRGPRRLHTCPPDPSASPGLVAGQSWQRAPGAWPGLGGSGHRTQAGFPSPQAVVWRALTNQTLPGGAEKKTRSPDPPRGPRGTGTTGKPGADSASGSAPGLLVPPPSYSPSNSPVELVSRGATCWKGKEAPCGGGWGGEIEPDPVRPGRPRGAEPGPRFQASPSAPPPPWRNARQDPLEMGGSGPRTQRRRVVGLGGDLRATQIDPSAPVPSFGRRSRRHPPRAGSCPQNPRAGVDDREEFYPHASPPPAPAHLPLHRVGGATV
ncbi:basic proline-rich protein-like [Lontra canadensis]|uniref:basic proline-rich protein-like n=1 Tax=Lontra canadensis TaxID=76717 RepID=UPI0013F3386E|nr:basic proline-rich protein-like [Lontra canadensis]